MTAAVCDTVVGTGDGSLTCAFGGIRYALSESVKSAYQAGGVWAEAPPRGVVTSGNGSGTADSMDVNTAGTCACNGGVTEGFSFAA